MSKTENMIGNVAFMVGFFGAILVGLLSAFGAFEFGAWASALLIIAGLVIGFLNVNKKERVPMMVATLIIGAGSAALASLEIVGSYIEAILSSLALVAVPAGIVIAFMVFMERARK